MPRKPNFAYKQNLGYGYPTTFIRLSWSQHAAWHADDLSEEVG